MTPVLTPQSLLRLVSWSLAAALAIVVAPAHADCVDGTREPRPAEREFHDRAMSALVALLPPVPPGATLESGPAGPEQADRLTFLCKEQKEGQFELLVRRSYALAPDKASEQRAWDQRQALSGRIQALQRLPAEGQAEQNRITAQVNELEARRMQLLKNKDQPGADAMYQREIKPLNDRWYRIRDEHLASVKPQVDALEAERRALEVKPQTVRVALAINQVRLPSASAVPSVGSQGLPAPQRSQGLKVLNTAWAILGDEGPLRDALSTALAVERLRALVGQPLPTAEQSRAWAAGLPVPALPQALAAPGAAPMPGPTAVAPVAAVGPAPTPAPNAAPPAAGPTPGSTAAAPAAAKPPASSPEAAKPSAVTKAAEGIQKLRGLLGR